MAYQGPIRALGDVDTINVIFNTPTPYRTLRLTVYLMGIARVQVHDDGYIERKDISTTAFELREPPLGPASVNDVLDEGDTVVVEYLED